MQHRRSKPIKIAPQLPHPAMPQADWADCYQLRVDDRDLTAIAAARLILGHFPPWARMLMAIRNAAVAPFGLKPAAAHASPENEMIGIFPVVTRSEKQVVLGFDDRHLDFRAVVEVSRENGQTIVSMTTLVRRKVLFGKLYLAVITPFHNLIVASALANLNRLPGGVVSRPPSR